MRGSLILGQIRTTPRPSTSRRAGLVVVVPRQGAPIRGATQKTVRLTRLPDPRPTPVPSYVGHLTPPPEESLVPGAPETMSSATGKVSTGPGTRAPALVQWRIPARWGAPTAVMRRVLRPSAVQRLGAPALGGPRVGMPEVFRAVVAPGVLPTRVPRVQPRGPGAGMAEELGRLGRGRVRGAGRESSGGRWGGGAFEAAGGVDVGRMGLRGRRIRSWMGWRIRGWWLGGSCWTS